MLLLLLLALVGSAEAGERKGIYDEKGKYQGYIGKTYTDKCCAIYDKKGRYVGKLGETYTSGKGGKNGKY